MASDLFLQLRLRLELGFEIRNLPNPTCLQELSGEKAVSTLVAGAGVACGVRRRWWCRWTDSEERWSRERTEQYDDI